MNWEAIGAIGEIIGALAVFATLVYLAIQIKQNSNMMKANIKEQRAAETQVQLQRAIDLAGLIIKRTSGEALSPTESLQYQLLFRGNMRNYEAYYRQYTFGLFDEGEWKGIRKTIEIMIVTPRGIEEWESIRSEFSEDFQSFIETLQK